MVARSNLYFSEFGRKLSWLSVGFIEKLLRSGSKASPTTLTLKDRYDANNDRNKVFNRPRVKGSDNRSKARTTRIAQGIFRRSIWTADHRRWRAHIFI